MAGHAFKTSLSETARPTFARLLMLSICFALGGGVGLLFAVIRTPDTGLEGALRAALELFAQGGSVSFPQALWSQLRWPLAAMFLGLTALGVVGIPLLMALRGFLLCFTAGSFAAVLGMDGLLAAWALLGVSGLVGLPALLLAEDVGLSGAFCRLNGLSRPDSRTRTVALLGMVLTSALAVFLQRLLTPMLAELVCGQHL